MVVSQENDKDDFYVYLRTLDGAKANKLYEILRLEYPDVKIMTFEIDQPVYYLDLVYLSGDVRFNVISVGEPEYDSELRNVTIKRKTRLV